MSHEDNGCDRRRARAAAIGRARRCALVVFSSLMAWTDLRGAAAQVGDAPGEGAAGEPPASAPAGATTDVPKSECFTDYEEAQVARRQGRLLDARSWLRLCSRASCPAAIRTDCVDWLDQVGRSLPSVVVIARAKGADVADVKVFIDDRLVAERLSGAALDVDPGQHRFRFQSPPWPIIERTILVNEGVQGRPIDVELAPPPSPPTLAANRSSPVGPPAPAFRRLETVDYVLGAVALTSLGMVGYLGGSALQERRQLLERCAPFCKESDVSAIRTKLILADVSLAVAVVSLAIDIYLRAVRPDEPVPVAALGVSLRLTAAGRGAALAIGGAF